jgi:hypothetical protein
MIDILQSYDMICKARFSDRKAGHLDRPAIQLFREILREVYYEIH